MGRRTLPTNFRDRLALVAELPPPFFVEADVIGVLVEIATMNAFDPTKFVGVK